MDLYPRNIESVLKVALSDTPVVCLTGPRRVGKTTLVKSLNPKKLNDQSLANKDPVSFMTGLPNTVIKLLARGWVIQ